MRFPVSQNLEDVFLDEELNLRQALIGPPLGQGRYHKIKSLYYLVILGLIGLV